MAVNPVVSLTRDFVQMHWQQRYTSVGINRKFLGMPNGVYLGFTPSSSPGSDILDLSPDINKGFSLAQVKSSSGAYGVCCFSDELVSLNFSGHAVFPVYVVLKANYQVNQESSATIGTQLTPPNGIDEIGICRVDAMGLTPIIVTDPAPNRHTPIANTGVEFGFMTGGAEQDRVAANAMIAEVIAAREDTDAVVWPTLKERIDAVGEELALSIDTIKSRVYTGVVGLSKEVSGDFSNTSRLAALTRPFVTIAGGASESSPGAIDQSDAHGRNFVAVRDVSTGLAPVDLVTGSIVYGRLNYTGATIPGTLTFTTASTVVGTSVDVTATVSIGDIVEGADGNFYLVVGTTVASLTLESAYQGASGNGTGLARRRFSVDLKKRSGGVESNYTVIRTALIQPTFSVGNKFLHGETITYNGKTGTVVFNTPEGSGQIYYIPTVATDLILTSENIVGGTSMSEVAAVPGTPTLSAPDFEFFFNVFVDHAAVRYAALLDWLHAAGASNRPASETSAGVVRFALVSESTPGLALQASDSRILTSDQAGAAASANAPTALNPFITNVDFNPVDLCAKAAAFKAFSLNGTTPGTGYARTVMTFAAIAGQSDSHPSQAGIATIGGAGEITLTRPPVGLLYHYKLSFLGAGGGTGFLIAAIREFNVAFDSSNKGTEQAGGAGFDASFTCSVVVAVDDAGAATLPNVFEVIDLSHTASFAAGDSRLLIERTARPA